MIVCKLELWPGGDESAAEHLGTIEIRNLVYQTAVSQGKRGTYAFKVFKKRKKEPSHEGVIFSFPRKSKHPWNLVMEILNNAKLKHGAV